MDTIEKQIVQGDMKLSTVENQNENSVEVRLRSSCVDGKESTKSPEIIKNSAYADVNLEMKDETLPTATRCSKLAESCEKCCMPCLRKYNPLPEHPNILQRLCYSVMLPLHGNVAQYLQFVIICGQIWAVLIALTHEQAMPGGNLFSLLMLFVACAVSGYLMSLIRLPPLLGMLIMGVMLRNIPGLKAVGEGIDPRWSGALRKLALTVILIKAGLGLDPVKLKKLSFAMARLAFIPCLSEAITVGIVSHFLLGFPWKWSLMLGCILSALSPAVTVPLLVNLQGRKYGVAKGIPTMCLAAGGLDNVTAITGFAVFLGIIFSEGDIAVTIVKGPMGALLGVVYGFVMGFLLWFLPAKDSPSIVFYRSILLFGTGMVAIFGSSAVGLSGAGPLGCLTAATVAAYKWRQQRQSHEADHVANVMGQSWLIVQHFLFGLIGAAVNIGDIEPSMAGLGIATLFIGLFVRSIASSIVTLGTGFNIKERVFITLTWLSKATVQAAIGGLALDKAMETNASEEIVKLGTDVLTLSVLAIVICAPLGATCMTLLGPRLLVKGEEEELEYCADGNINADLASAKCDRFTDKPVFNNTDVNSSRSKPCFTVTNGIISSDEKVQKDYMQPGTLYTFRVPPSPDSAELITASPNGVTTNTKL